jgi:hypothetical protein
MPGDSHSSIRHNRSEISLSRCIDDHIVYLSTSAIIECQMLINQFLTRGFSGLEVFSCHQEKTLITLPFMNQFPLFLMAVPPY